MILADSSAWIEYDRGTGSAVDQRVAELISTSGPLAVTEPVVMEVLAGARTDSQEDGFRRLLLSCQLLSFDPAADFDAAVRIYWRCRRAGITPQGMIDCIIAAVAWRHGAALLVHDADLDRLRGPSESTWTRRRFGSSRARMPYAPRLIVAAARASGLASGCALPWKVARQVDVIRAVQETATGLV